MRDALPEDAVTDDAPLLLAGRYRLEGMLGSGGMGTVYRARDLELDVVIALKLLQQSDPETLAGFRDEVKLARRVTHRNVARTYDIGEYEGARFLTMEYVEGETLSRLLARGRLAPSRAFELATEVTQGLAAVHAEGLAHGDLKPGNVLVDVSGKAKVSDFGLARIAESASTGASPGTPEYMGPEQLSGSLADARSDVFALGTLFSPAACARSWSAASPPIRTRASPMPPRCWMRSRARPRKVTRRTRDLVPRRPSRSAVPRGSPCARSVRTLPQMRISARLSLPTSEGSSARGPSSRCWAHRCPQAATRRSSRESASPRTS